MTSVVVDGITPSSLHFVRYALSQPTLEVVGIVPGDVSDDALAYAFANDSAAAAFRGTVDCEAGALVLAGRYGRGGLRHDRIPLYGSVDDAIGGPRLPDCVVVAEDRPPVGGDPHGVRCLHLGDDVPDPIDVAVAGIADALSRLAAVSAVFVTVVGPDCRPIDDRDRLLAMRGPRAGAAVRVIPAGPATLATGVVGAVPGPVALTTAFFQLMEPVSADAVVRRLRSAARGALGEDLRLDTGPVGTRDALGSPVSLVDLGTIGVADRAVCVGLVTDTLAARTRLACSLADAVAAGGGATPGHVTGSPA